MDFWFRLQQYAATPVGSESIGQMVPRLRSEQLAPQHTSQAEDARTEQHDAAGLRNRSGRRGASAGST